jgi:hypothetical protein
MLNYLVNNILLVNKIIPKGIILVILISYITLGYSKSLDP